MATLTITLPDKQFRALEKASNRLNLVPDDLARLLLDAFLEGATAEEIAYQYPSLDLSDVYSVIGYYLHHRTKVDAYIRERKRDARKIREENEIKFSPKGIRERLLARQGN